MSEVRHLSMDETLAIRTPEHVALALDVAGIGSRALAYLIDSLIRLVAAMLLVYVPVGIFKIGQYLPDAWQQFQAVLYFGVIFFLMWLYMPAFEALWEGQTPGKRITKIRVVKDDGTPITVLDAILRNVLRIVDSQFMYGVGLVTMLLNRGSKRVGDYVAGTIVVKERQFTLDQYLERDAAGGWIGRATNTPEVALPAVLAPTEYEVVTRFLDRAGDFDAETRTTLAEQIAAPFRARSELATAVAEFPQAEALLAALAARGSTSTAAAPAAPTPTGARLTAPQALDRFVAARRARWDRLTAHLKEIGEHGLKTLSHRQLAELGRLYRQTSADHALSQTYYPGAAVAGYLNRLVVTAHNKIYRRGGLTWQTLLDFYLVEVPAAFRTNIRFFWLSLSAFGLPALAAFALVLLDSRFSSFVVSPYLMDHIERGEMWTQDLWIHTPGTSGFEGTANSTAWAVWILTNNIRVTVMVFASGMLLGIGTLWYLALNGFVLGAISALTWQYGMADKFWAFVTPHGVIEISMILIGGMGGFMLGNCILAPGRYTRRDAFRQRGRAAGRLMLACVPVLILAGFIEGNFSAMPAPLWLKVSFGLTLGAVLYAYLFGYSPRRDTAWDATPVGPTAARAPSLPGSD